MRYEYHNFVDNLKNIKKSKDMAITRELVVSEIAKVIDGRPFLVKKALIDCGISLSNEADKTELVYVTFFNLAKSECLRRSIAELIYNNQYPVIADKKRRGSVRREDLSDFDTDKSLDSFMYSSGSGSSGSSGGSSGASAGDWISGITQVIGVGVGLHTSSKTFKDNAAQRAHEMKLAQMNTDLALQQMQLSANQPVAPVTQAGIGGSSTIIYVLVGVAVLGLIGYSVYMSRKNVATA
tara:strand:- start:29 stop:742 length:714 start_codon:yes stop_codon:yes gene_type:complete